MIDLGTAITAVYSNAITVVDYAFEQDPDTGDLTITTWNEDKLGPRPSMQELEERAEVWSIEAAKLAKKQEIASKAIGEMAFAYTAGVEGRDELQFELTKAILAIGQALGISEITDNQKLKEVARCGGKGRQKQAEIEAATSVEEVEAITWEMG